MSTDDAYVQADRVGISTDVSGIVQDVAVKDNEHVEAGQVLYRLDPRQFQIALDNAKANLAQTAMSIDAMKQDYQRMLSDVAAQQAQVDLDQKNYDRNAMLLKTATVSQAAFDQTRYTLDNDKSKLAASQQQVKVQLAKLGGDPDTPTTEHPQYRQAKAQVDEAQRQLDHTVVKAPFAGTVTNVPSIAPGKYLSASTTAFFLVDTDHVWIDATPRAARADARAPRCQRQAAAAARRHERRSRCRYRPRTRLSLVPQIAVRPPGVVNGRRDGQRVRRRQPRCHHGVCDRSDADAGARHHHR